jgi:hypothetical protein
LFSLVFKRNIDLRYRYLVPVLYDCFSLKAGEVVVSPGLSSAALTIKFTSLANVLQMNPTSWEVRPAEAAPSPPTATGSTLTDIKKPAKRKDRGKHLIPELFLFKSHVFYRVAVSNVVIPVLK